MIVVCLLVSNMCLKCWVFNIVNMSLAGGFLGYRFSDFMYTNTDVILSELNCVNKFALALVGLQTLLCSYAILYQML